ncbi:hypothetical protein MUK72_14485 (plasmid) [Halococcus dombrowskii]|uniref:Uncharacterized protein n=1 Tax=Halococcus dombrowskii TaxID=179637 RepID=A0AAV3SL66_HALDO|nr:hypothetical protein [Halococcus dombrowskii]UOO96752.1 hypothetical protein MUK72_14485 [Halococcus dombrowskii]
MEIGGYAQVENDSNNTGGGSSGNNTSNGSNNRENQSGDETENNSNNTNNESGGKLDGVRSAYNRYLGNTTSHYVNGTKEVGAAAKNAMNTDFDNASKNVGNATDEYANGTVDLAKGHNRARDDAINATENALPSGFGLSVNIATGWFESAENRTESMINDLGWMLVSVPAPGNTTEPGTWYPGFASPVNSTKVNNTGNYTASNDVGSLGTINKRTDPILPGWISLDKWWESSWKIYVGLAALVTSPLLVLGVFAWAKPGRAREREKRLQDVFVAFMLVLFGVVVMPGILHGANLLSTGVIPGGQELLRTPGNMAKLGIGLLSINLATVAIALVFGFIQWLMLFFVAALWPLYAALWASGSKTAKSYSKLGFSLFGLLLGLKFLQALWLRFIFWLPLGFGDPVTSIFSLFIIIFGVFIGFVVFPIYGAVKVVPSFVVNIVKQPLETGGRYLMYK